MSSPVGDVALPSRELPPAAFGAPFWFSYVANTLMMVAVSTLFVYADFVRSLGGSELQLGRIVGIGMIGAIAMRFVQGIGIDRIGARHVWLWSNAGFIVCCLLHLTIKSVDGWAIYLLRIGYQSCLAGFFGASIAYISGRAPIARLAEVIGTLGTSGFVGMMIGSRLGAHLLGAGTATRAQIDSLFIASAAAGALAFVCAFMATLGQVRKVHTRKHPPLWWLLRRYNPGLILLMSVATGMGLNLPTVFLRPYMVDIGMPDGVEYFFTFYPPIAFASRLLLRRFPDRFGIRPMVALGLAGVVIGTLLFMASYRLWLLLLPAVFLGVAHASLFPAVVAGASGAFPGRYRGLGTTLVLAMFDVGVLIGSPLAGQIISTADHLGWPKYPTMFTAISALLTLCGIVYFTFSRKTPSRRGM
jgi:MFS family permease